MVCIAQPGGKSFAAIVRYTCQDASNDVSPQLKTTTRVAFVGTLNLPECSPEDAARIMTRTVRDAEDLKALAGL